MLLSILNIFFGGGILNAKSKVPSIFYYIAKEADKTEHHSPKLSGWINSSK